LAVVGVLPVLTAAGPAAAQSEADRLFDEGVAAFERGDYAEALGAFEGSYAVDPAPDTLLNIGMCRSLVGRNAEAVNALRRYPAAAGGTVPQEELDSIRRQMDDVVPTVGQIVLDVSEPGARLLIDGVEVGVSPLGWSVAVEPGRHSVEARKGGFELATASGEVAAGGVVTVSLVLSPSDVGLPEGPRPVETPRVEVAATSPAERDEGLSAAWFWVSAGVAGALAVAGAATGGCVLALEDEFDDPATTRARQEEIKSEGDPLEVATTALFVAAGAAAVAAVALAIFTDFGGSEEPEEPAVAIGVGPVAGGADGLAGVMLDARLRF
jgi:hypothetical protein